jgi:hypothetical protein
VRSGHRAAGSAQRGFLAPLGVLLGRAPVDVEAVLGVDAAHVDALDGAGRAHWKQVSHLSVPELVVEQDQPAAVVGRDLLALLGVLDRALGLGHAHA